MSKLLIVVDMQNDFIDGALGTPQAQDCLLYTSCFRTALRIFMKSGWKKAERFCCRLSESLYWM